MNPGAITWPSTSMTRAGVPVMDGRNAHDGIALDRNIAAVPRAAGPVHDPAVAEHDVIARGLSGPEVEDGRGEDRAARKDLACHRDTIYQENRIAGRRRESGVSASVDAP